MAQCKLSGCREEAVPFGKRYCPAHKAEYERKRREYDLRAKTFPLCAHCGKPVPHEQADRCEGMHYNCRESVLTERVARTTAEIKQVEFSAADTVQALKEWLVKWDAV